MLSITHRTGSAEAAETITDGKKIGTDQFKVNVCDLQKMQNVAYKCVLPSTLPAHSAGCFCSDQVGTQQ